MRMLCFIDESGNECFVNVDDISAIIAAGTKSSKGGIYLCSDREIELAAKYTPEVVAAGKVIEI